jgi:hypothetical protein
VPQIVNGLQTSRSIFDYFADSPHEGDKRMIVVRVIVTPVDKPDLSDAVIRATNSQNKMAPSSLRATDSIHRQIEQLFKQYDLYYDRRKGSHKDDGLPVTKIVSINQVLQAMLATVLARPDEARARPGDYITQDEKYESIFKPDLYPLAVYLKATEIMRRVNRRVAEYVIDRGTRRNLVFYVATFAVWDATETATPTADDVIKAGDIVTVQRIDAAIKKVQTLYDKLGGDDNVAKGPNLLKRLLKDMRARMKRKKK